MPGALAGLDGAGLAVADEHHPADARHARGPLTTSPSGSRTSVPAVTYRPASTTQSSPRLMPMPPLAPIRQRSPIVDLLGPATRQRAHDRRPAADVGALADDHALRDPALDHRRAERAGVEVAEALVHHDGALGQVGAQADPGGVGDAHARRDHVVGHRRELVEAAHDQRAPVGPQRQADVVEVGRRRPGRGPSTPRSPAGRTRRRGSALRGGGEAVRQQVQAQVDVGRRRRRLVDVDGQPDRSHRRPGARDRHARHRPARASTSSGASSPNSPQPEPAEPGVEGRAVGGLGGEAGAPGDARSWRGLRVGAPGTGSRRGSCRRRPAA